MILPTLGCGEAPSQIWLQECPGKKIPFDYSADQYAALFKKYVGSPSAETKILVEAYTNLFKKTPSSLVKQLQGPCLGVCYALVETVAENQDVDLRNLRTHPDFINKALFYSLFDIIRARAEHQKQLEFLSTCQVFMRVYSKIHKDTYRVENDQFLPQIRKVLLSKESSIFTLRLWQNLDMIETVRQKSRWVSPHAIFISLHKNSFFADTSFNMIIRGNDPQSIIDCFLDYITTLRKEYLAIGVIWRFENFVDEQDLIN